MRLKIFKTTGETLAESIIALSILAIGITISGLVVSSSLTNVQGSKKRIIALNVGREAIEGVRNIRDTNWLKFSSDRRSCWNHLPLSLDNPAHDKCTQDEAIEPGDYSLYIDNHNQWRLKNYDDSDPDSFLSIVDIDPNLDSDEDGNKTNDQDLFNHLFGDALGSNLVKSSIFRRKVAISYLDNDGSDGQPTDNRMRVDVLVEWQEKTPQRLLLSTLITDYLGRENLND
ncbi:type II secretion system protein [Candidatus Peregrinibacteria bacterium]|nr:type II secretion system protein [Candidatus Peregrinibacteria bacterium]